jgi:hypothetical protein
VTLDLSKFEPTFKNWFEPSVDYSGYGRAEFSDPPGVIEGPTKVQFDESGKSTIEMDVEKMEPDSTEPMRALLFLCASPPVVEAGKAVRYVGGRTNPCLKLTVTCENGVFSASDRISCSSQSSFTTGEERVIFQVLRSSFDAKDGQPPRYWVLPLLNFLSEFHPGTPSLDRHPLRTTLMPTIPSGLTDSDATLADLYSHSQARLVAFQFNGTFGFIEPLPDYKDKETKLTKEQERQTLTALMVGDMGTRSTDLSALESWFPFDFLALLGLATGSEVGAPWIEFRDAEGKLVRRAHRRLGSPSYTKGRKPFEEGVHDGIGRLLTQATTSPHWGKTYLRVAMRHLVRGGRYGMPVEDSLSYLCRGLDALCEEFGFKKTIKSKDVLRDDYRRAVRKAISDALKAIRAVAATARKEGNVSEADVLNRVAQQIAQAANFEIGFGKAVVALLKHFGLPDAEIMAPHLESNPRPDGRGWPEVVSMCRGTSTHRGYFDFRHGDADIHDVFKVLQHLHDILIRTVLKMLNYDGTYQPTVAKHLVQARVDWVTPSTTPEELGY